MYCISLHIIKTRTVKKKYCSLWPETIELMKIHSRVLKAKAIARPWLKVIYI